jgi:hypothetical protein
MRGGVIAGIAAGALGLLAAGIILSRRSAAVSLGRQGWTFIFSNGKTSLETIKSNDAFSVALPTCYNVNNSTGTFTPMNLTDGSMTPAEIESGILAMNLKCYPTIMGGQGNGGTDNGIIALLTDSTAFNNFVNASIAEAKKNKFQGYNLDFEPGSALNQTKYSSLFTNFLSKYHSALRSNSLSLSINVAGWFVQGYGGNLINLKSISPYVDFVCDMDYSYDYSIFTLGVKMMLANVPLSKIAIILETYYDDGHGGGSNRIAGKAIDYLLNNNIPILALWPSDLWNNSGIVPSGLTWFQAVKDFISGIPITIPPRPGGWTTYTVQQGQGWYQIAVAAMGSNYANWWHYISNVNPQISSLQPGDIVNIPPKKFQAGKYYTVQQGQGWFQIATAVYGAGWLGDYNKQNNDKITLAILNPQITTLMAGDKVWCPPVPGYLYTVKSGQGWYQIAQDVYGNGSLYKILIAANPNVKVLIPDMQIWAPYPLK